MANLQCNMSDVPTSEESLTAPAVVAVVILEEGWDLAARTLATLAAQDYPNISTVVRHGTDITPEQIQSILPNAICQPREPGKTVSHQLNEAIGWIQGAPFICTIVGPVFLRPTVIRVMVEEAFRSNAAVIGPKFVAADGSGHLMDVGWYVDRTGHPYSGIESDEIDQEQRDGVRDVFFVTREVMLMRRDLWDAIGSFDEGCEPGASELDFCWRARIAGARVMVAPDATVETEQLTLDRRSLKFPKARTRTLVRNASWWSLLWAIPAGIVLAIVEALGLLVARRPRRAAATLGAWFGVVFSPSSWSSRRAVQRHRTVSDSDLRFVQIRGSARVREFLERYHADDRLAAAGDATRAVAADLLDLLRQPLTYGWVVFIGMAGFGSRKFLSDGFPHIGQMMPWIGTRALGGTFSAAWRTTGFGAARPASPAFLIMSGWTAITGGDPTRAATWFVLTLWLLGAIGVYRLVRPFDRLPLAALVGGLAYGVNPLIFSLLSTGNLPSLALYAGAPWVLHSLIRAGRAPKGSQRSRALISGAIWLAVVGCFQPLVILLLPVVAIAWLLTLPIGGGPAFVLRAIPHIVIVTLGALALVFPWPLSFVRSGFDPIVVGLAPRPEISLGQILSFGSTSAIVGWLLVVAAALPLLIANGERLTWAVRAWVMIVLGVGLSWIGPRIGSIPWASNVDTTVLVAVACAFAIGLGIGAITDELQESSFGWRQGVAGAAVLSLCVPAIVFLNDSFDGAWHAPTRSWSDATANFSFDTNKAEFRVLWISPVEAAVGAPVTYESGVAIGLTRNGAGDIRDLLPASAGTAEAVMTRSLEEARSGLTNRVGELLGPMGIRYVAIVDRQSPDSEPVPLSDSWRRSFDVQLDLVARRVEPGMVLYENTNWVPIRSTFQGKDSDRLLDGVDAADPLDAASKLASTTPQAFPGTKASKDDAVFLAEANDPGWKSNGSNRFAAFGWANAFSGPASTIEYEGDSKWNLARGVGALAWVVAFGALFFLRRRRVEG